MDPPPRRAPLRRSGELGDGNPQVRHARHARSGAPSRLPQPAAAGGHLHARRVRARAASRLPPNTGSACLRPRGPRLPVHLHHVGALAVAMAARASELRVPVSLDPRSGASAGEGAGDARRPLRRRGRPVFGRPRRGLSPGGRREPLLGAALRDPAAGRGLRVALALEETLGNDRRGRDPGRRLRRSLRAGFPMAVETGIRNRVPP